MPASAPYEPSSAPPGLASALGRLAQDRDAQAWAALLAHAGADIQRLASRLTGDAALAEDAVQETLLLIRDHAGRFAARGGEADDDARRWILGVAANASLQLLRRQRRQAGRDQRAGREAAQASEGAGDPAERTERADEGRLLRRELAALPSAYGQALTLHYLGGQDYPALAAQLQVPVNTVRTRVHRGLKALRQRLGRCGVALSLAALTGALTELGAATTAATTLPAAAAGLLASSAMPTTALATASGGLLMATVLGGALAATIAVTVVVPWLGAQEPPPRSAPVPVVQPAVASATAPLPVVAAVAPTPAIAQPPAGTPAAAPAPAATAAALGRRVSFQFEDTPSSDAWRFLAQVMGVPIRVDADVVPALITLTVGDMRMGSALSWLAELSGAAWHDGGDHIRIARKPAAAPAAAAPMVAAPLAQLQDAGLDHAITLDFQDTALDEAVSFLRKVTGLNLVIDPRIVAGGMPTLTLRVEQMKTRFVLDFVGKLSGLAWVQRDEALFLTPAQGVLPPAAVPPPPPAAKPPATQGADNF